VGAVSPRERRRRGAEESLGAVILGFESIVVFLGGLAVYGLKGLPDGVDPWWGIVGGVVVAVVMVLTTLVLRFRWGIWLGWALQVLVFLSGFLAFGLFIVGVIFGAMWGYATIKGAQLDRRNARLVEGAENGD
jgi:high-affinity Fe2+/Pb2+ permease